MHVVRQPRFVENALKNKRARAHTHTLTDAATKTHNPACAALCCALGTDGSRVKDTNESNETEGKTAREIYTTVKHLRETGRDGALGVGLACVCVCGNVCVGVGAGGAFRNPVKREKRKKEK